MCCESNRRDLFPSLMAKIFCSNSRFVLVQRTCFLVAERSNGCEEKDWECKCKPFKAPVINSVDEACILKECGTQKAAQAQSALSTVCNCPRPRPTKVPEITFPDSESAEDPPPTTTAEPSMTTAESPTPSSEKHRHPHLHRLTEKIPLFNAAKMAMKGIFHHSS